MNLNDVIDYFGSRTEAASALGMTTAAFKYWEKLEKIPLRSQVRIEKITGGELLSDYKNVEDRVIDIIYSAFDSIEDAAAECSVSILQVCRWIVGNYMPIEYYPYFPEYFLRDKKKKSKKKK